jgi:SpoVK/Ycf46/Vps4 family AAA+-type ATPase
LELDPKLVESLRRAIDALPEDAELRLHLAALLIEAGRRDEGIRELGVILQADPANAKALALITGTQPAGDPGALSGPEARSDRSAGDELPSQAESAAAPELRAVADSSTQGHGGPSSHAEPSSPDRPAEADFDWGAAESQLADVLPPRFVSSDGTPERMGAAAEDSAAGDSGEPGSSVFDVEHAGLRLSDVAGMTDVKQRLEAAFLAPMRNPELRKLYGKSLRGGLLMYGPPGCGKTFIARAVAGELGARFLAVSFADVIDSMLGQSERNIHEIFGVARQNAPCVVFLDEVDAIGQKRTQLRHTPMRAVVNQLLLELDDVTGSNEGIFLLAATNHPWDVDSALRRPGRFDRMLLVLPPDQPARAAIFRYHLRERPVERVDLERLAKLSDGYSGADIAHVCESAAELALLDSVRRGEPRMISQPDLEAAMGDVRPSLNPWFDAARNVALFANEGGAYDDLAAYLKKKRLL